ncbi:ABC transporter ATP-binding protein [candidate division WOR-3 bacterium]|nr:ABC transporter ATP-binding protein [candidate division WOR-3 bacterium]
MRFHRNDDLLEKESRKYTTVELITRVFPFIKPFLGQFFAATLLLLIVTTCNLAAPLILKEVVDKAIPDKNVSEVLVLALLFTAVFVFSVLVSYSQIMMMTKIGLSIIRDLKAKLFDHLMTLSMYYYDENPTGKLMARVESDTERVRMLFSDVSMSLVANMLMFTGTVFIMMKTNLKLTLMVMVFLLPVAFTTYFFLNLTRKLTSRVRSSFARMTAFITEYVRAVQILQIFKATEMAQEKMHEVGKDFLRKEVKAYTVEYVYWSFIGACEILVVIIILIGGKSGLSTGVITIGTVILFVEYTRRLFMPLVQFSETLNQVQRAFASADRIFSILDTKTKTPDGVLGMDDFPENWRELAFENVWFKYKEEWVLKGVSFTIPKGAMWAIVGASGSGKTTLISLLMRYYEPTHGSIKIGGVDIRNFKLEVWRSKIGLVLQNVSLFSGTLSENLTVFNPEISNHAQLKALDKVHAREIVEKFPNGIEEEISEGGLNISMGERQLLCFARAVLYNPPILVLDEATSSVDPGTEKKIQEATSILTEGRTSIVVAHRLSTITNAKKIIVLQKGEIVEEGDHQALLKSEGIYASLYRLQEGEIIYD